MAAHRAKSAIIGEFKAMTSKSFYKDPVEKIGILQPQPKALTYAVPRPTATSQTTKKSKVVPSLNYSEVFYSNKQTVFTHGKSPRENLRDIFAQSEGSLMPR